MNFRDEAIADEWHYVIGGASGDQQLFYQELEAQWAGQVEALGLKSGYKKIGGGLFSRRTAHFVKYGSYQSLTLAEPFGEDLNIAWYLYDPKAGSPRFIAFISILIDLFSGRTRDRVAAFGGIGQDAANQATQSLLQGPRSKPSEASGQLGAL